MPLILRNYPVGYLYTTQINLYGHERPYFSRIGHRYFLRETSINHKSWNVVSADAPPWLFRASRGTLEKPWTACVRVVCNDGLPEWLPHLHTSRGFPMAEQTLTVVTIIWLLADAVLATPASVSLGWGAVREVPGWRQGVHGSSEWWKRGSVLRGSWEERLRGSYNNTRVSLTHIEGRGVSSFRWCNKYDFKYDNE